MDSTSSPALGEEVCPDIFMRFFERLKEALNPNRRVTTIFRNCDPRLSPEVKALYDAHLIELGRPQNFSLAGYGQVKIRDVDFLTANCSKCGRPFVVFLDAGFGTDLSLIKHCTSPAVEHLYVPDEYYEIDQEQLDMQAMFDPAPPPSPYDQSFLNYRAQVAEFNKTLEKICLEPITPKAE